MKYFVDVTLTCMSGQQGAGGTRTEAEDLIYVTFASGPGKESAEPEQFSEETPAFKADDKAASCN